MKINRNTDKWKIVKKGPLHLLIAVVIASFYIGACLLPTATAGENSVKSRSHGQSNPKKTGVRSGGAADGSVVTGFSIEEKDGATTEGYPVTFGHVFKRGDIFNSVAVRTVGCSEVLPTQLDRKRSYDDGSLKFGIISFVIPRITAHEIMEFEIITTQTNESSQGMSTSEILNMNFDGRIELTGTNFHSNKNLLSINVRNILEDSGDLSTRWLEGDVVTELLLDSAFDEQLHGKFEVRIYPEWDGIRVSHTVENVWGDYRGNVDYSVDIYMGTSDDLTYHKNTFTHNVNSRWRKVLWLGNEPPEVEIKFNIDYIISTGMIMNYDTSLVISEDAVASSYNRWQASDHDIMGTGYLQTYFATTGDREEIGVLPTWTTRYLLSMDNRMKEVMLNHAELFAGCPIHYKESDPTRPFYGHIVSIDDRPTAWLGRDDFRYIKEADRFADPIGSEDTVWYIDRAHQASYAYIPYMVTGDYFYLEELYYWAGYDLAASNFNSSYGRDYSRGLIRDQVRGEAWAIRNIADAAAICPDGDIEKAYFEEKIDNNIAEWMAEKDRYPLNYWGSISSLASEGGRPTDFVTDNVGRIACPWQDDWMLTILTHMKEQGYATGQIIDWFSSFVINRFSHPDFNWFNGAPYRFPVEYIIDDEQIPTWKAANNAIAEPYRLVDSFPSEENHGSYRVKAYVALSCVTDQPGGWKAYNWMHNQITNREGCQYYTSSKNFASFREVMEHNPKWAILPRVRLLKPIKPKGLTCQ